MTSDHPFLDEVHERRTVTVTAEFGGRYDNDDPYTADTEVEVAIGPEGSVYSDGRRIISAIARGTLGDAEYTAHLDRKKSLRGGPVSFSGYARPPASDEYSIDADELPDELETRGSPGLRIDGEAFERVNEIYEEMQEEITARRDEVEDSEGLSVRVDRNWEEGSGEGHAIHARGAIAFEDGRELPIHWRNAVDIGHQVFVDRDDPSDEFSADEVDAAVALARNESPITTAMRM